MKPLRSIIKQLYRREGVRGPVVTLLSGTAVTLGISYLAIPVLTRLFTPAEFGVSDYFVMIVSILITFASLRFEDAVMLPESDQRAAAVLWLAGLLTFATTIIVAVVSIWGRPLAGMLRVADVAPWLWLIAPTLLLMRFGKLAEIWLVRQRAFRMITGGELTNKVTMLSARIGMGVFTGLGAGGLIGGFALSHVASCLYYFAALLRKAPSLLRRSVSAASIRSVASRYRRFPLYSSPAAALNAVVARLPVLLLPVYFGLDVVGLFGRAFAALAVPLGLIGTAVSQVFFVHAAEAHRAGRVAGITETIHARLVMLGLYPTIVLVIAGPELFEFVFGTPWRAAGTFERYLACWFFLTGVASPLTRLFDILEHQRAEFFISTAMCLILTAALVVGGRSGDVLLTMMLIAAAGSTIRLVHIAIMLKLAGVPLRRAVRPYLRYTLIGLPLAAPVWLVLDAWPPWAVALLAAATGLVYAAIVVWRERLLSP